MPIADDRIRYRIAAPRPETHYFELSCSVPDPDPAGQHFSLPAWIPGSYLIREFARHVVAITARCGEVPVRLEKLDKHTWQADPCAGPLTLRYTVYAFDLSVRAAYLDTVRGYFNGPAVFLMPHGREHRPCRLEIVPPAGSDWRVATAMRREEAAPYGFGSYRAADYDELIDHPVEMGRFALTQFEAGGVPHEVIVSGRQHADLDRLGADLQKICAYQIGLFGAPPPMDRYLFLVLAVGDGYGGLEHRASCSLICKRDELPRQGEGPEGLPDSNDPRHNAGYRGFLGLCSHEYFHTWNVKRIKPAAFTPYDLSRENHTRLLWAFEGITSYYDDLALLRAGLIDLDTYLVLLGESATRVWRGAGRLRQSVAESSFDAWIKFYRQDENSPNAVVSYYAKGALVALALDLLLRARAGSSLDELMRILWTRYGRTGQGVPEDGVEAVAQEIGGPDLRDFFARAVHGTEDLPLAELLAPFGIDFTLRPAESDSDPGGKPSPKPDLELAARPALGARIAKGAEARLTHVADGGAAQAAGLAPGDVILAVDGLRASGDTLSGLLAAHRPGTRVRVHFFRRDELMESDLLLQAPPRDTAVFTLRDDADETMRALRDDWARGGRGD